MRSETLLAAHALRRPDHPAVVCGAERLSYAELNESVRRAAAGLHRLGVRPGDRILLYLPNSIEFVQLAYGAFTVGATVVPVNTRLSANEVEHIARDCSPAVAIFHAGARDTVSAALRQAGDCRVLVLGGATETETACEQLVSGPPEPLSEVPLDAEDCMILYTSGTTGRPKGALLTHANMIVQNVTMHALQWGIGAGDRFLVVTSLAHRGGIARLYNALGLGGTLVVMEKFEPLAAMELIERERVTVAGLVPTILRMLLPHIRTSPDRLSSLCRIVVSTEAFPVALKREIALLLPGAELLSLFGMTEASVTTLGHAEHFSHPESVGRPIPGIEVRIVDDSGRNLPQGEVGEIWVRSGVPGRCGVMKGYFNRPLETAAAFTDGWFHSGDLGRFDAEGYLYVVDRKKDMVLSGGYNVYSKEVEHALDSHPDVAESAVIGVPDELFGEAVAAFVVARPGTRPTAQQLIEHCRTELAGYKKPGHVFFVDSLPKTSVGKVLKTELRKLAAKHGHTVQS
ncbi:MAG: AMP-binding protein [Betaproteobacteria bacterium]|nr:AMP-binding protein [Betaproteobacteria bacterium]